MTVVEFDAWTRDATRLTNGWRLDLATLQRVGIHLMFHVERGRYVEIDGATVTVGSYAGDALACDPTFVPEAARTFATAETAYGVVSRARTLGRLRAHLTPVRS